jgi:predicted Zn-ribbon and HTH transcriptional regulator
VTKQIVAIKNPAECDTCGYQWDSDLRIEVDVTDNGSLGAKLIGFEKRCPVCKSEDIVINILDETESENVVDETGG